MPIPFAELSSESEHVWNLQFYFWRNALEHFEQMKSTDYDEVEGVFEVDACMVIVLAGTSATQLLGQNVQSAGTRTPPPKQHFRQLTIGVDLASLGFAGLDSRFEEFIDSYDCIRHFGLSKHEEIRNIDEGCLCDFMTTAQDTWKLVAKLRHGGSLPHASYFENTFQLPL